MGAMVLFLAVIAAIVAWWLSHQGLTEKPWLQEDAVADGPVLHTSSVPPAKVGLGVFLAVAGSLFALLISAYSLRMGTADMGLRDWRPVPLPRLLWLNTAVLVLSSAALQWAQAAAYRGRMGGTRSGLFAAGILALAFLLGQVLAWWQLVAARYFVAANPANAFFYLITGAHGLHVSGGIVALGRTTAKAWRSHEAGDVRLSVELCAMYWHFLLLAWLVLFGLLNASSWPGWLYAMCYGSSG